MLTSVNISDYMLLHPVKVQADEDLFTAIELIFSEKVSGVCVVDADNTLLGVLSETDCMRAIIAETYNNSGKVGSVSNFMTKEVVCCSLHDNAIDVAVDMLKTHQRRRPVISEGKLVGQITFRQLLRLVSEFHKQKQHV